MHHQGGHNRRARILIADRDKTVAHVLSTILHDVGYDIATALSSEEAVSLALEFNPDLLACEVNMGRVSGVEAASRITMFQPHCKVLFFSGRASLFDVVRSAPERLVYSFTSKPLQVLTLMECIAYMLSPAHAVPALTGAPGESALASGASKGSIFQETDAVGSDSPIANDSPGATRPELEAALFEAMLQSGGRNRMQMN